MRGTLVANLACKFALSLHASIFEVCNPLDLQQILPTVRTRVNS